MSNEFFDKLKKGMNINDIPQAEFEAKDIEEAPPAEETPAEAELLSTFKEPEVVENQLKAEPPRVGKPAKKKTTRKKTSARKKKPPVKKKIEVKQEFSLKEDDIDEDIFQKEGQLTVDVFETDKDIIIQSAVAGVEPEDLDISIEKDMVSIKGKRERKIEEKTENFFYQECFWGRFSREVVLPSEVDKNKAEASMKNGVLTIKIPKINTTTNKKLNINVEE